MRKDTETYTLVGGTKCNEVLNKYPDYRVFWRSGYAWKGAKEEEDDKQTKSTLIPGGCKITTFEERMQMCYDWAAAIDINIDHKAKEIHFNGFSESDLW